MKPITLFTLLIGFTLFTAGCSTSTVKKVDVYEMESFSVIKEESLFSYTDAKDIRTFVTAFHNAKKVSGVVDVAEPDYGVEFGGDSYYLWISPEQGAIMHTTDTHTIYSLVQSDAKMVDELLNSAD